MYRRDICQIRKPCQKSKRARRETDDRFIVLNVFPHRTFEDCIEVNAEIIEEVDLHDVLMREHARGSEPEPAFYYHSDHLGSAAYLTDDQGQVTQTLNYLPYGEDWVDIRNNLDPNLGQYTFTGKERDEETGYGYFGARYMDHELMTMWLSVDPMADKYPSISPYAYCAWNPVKLVDPDGREVYITGDAAAEATRQLSSKRLTVTRDEKTGKLSYQINGNGRLLKREKQLIAAINDNDVRINIHASNQGTYKKSRGGKFDNTKTGQFLGVEYNPSPNADNPYKASTQQLVNPDVCTQRDKQFSAPRGLALYHEITESHQAGLISIEMKQSEGPAYDFKNGQPVIMSSPIYENAHMRASIQPREYPGYIQNLMQDAIDQISSHQNNIFGL